MNQIQDSELGLILLRSNSRAVRFTFSVKEGQLVATIPLHATKKELLHAVEKLRPRLRELLSRQQSKQKAHHVTPDFRIQVEGFDFRTEKSEKVETFTLSWNEGQLILHYPPNADFENDEAQKWMVLHIEERLREQARKILLPRLSLMAKERGLRFQELSIHKSRGRWGSCSAQGHIALSLFVMLLPRHLQDYVIQHELTHLLHMDHSERFWAELDKVMKTDSRLLRKELKKYDTSIFSS